MRLRNVDVALRLVATFAFVGIAFVLLEARVRDLEAGALAAIVGMLGGAQDVYRLPGANLLLFPQDGTPSVASVTASCSAIGATLAFAAVAIFVLRGSRWRRARGALLATLVVVVANLVRITLAVEIGLHQGHQAMVTFHDWIGTAIGLVALLAGFMVLLGSVLPSTTTILARRVHGAS